MNKNIQQQSYNVKNLIRSSLLLALVIVFQSIGRAYPQISQFFVGTAINCILLVATQISSLGWGITIGMMTPLFAWLLGQLNPAFAPFIPFIIIGNLIYIIIFWYFKRYKRIGAIVGIIIGALFKYLFLYISASKLIGLLNLSIPPKLVSKLVVAMGVPQLITAVIGGFIAIIILKVLSKTLPRH